MHIIIIILTSIRVRLMKVLKWRLLKTDKNFKLLNHL